MFNKKNVLIGLCLSLVGAPALAELPVEVLDVDLAPLIDDSASWRERFAVNVPHALSTAADGQWTTSGSTRTWTYSVRIPSAVSLSFHAPQVRFSPSVRLTVSGREATASYDADDARRGLLWGRPLLGDTLTFTLTVDESESSALQFHVASLQAGYRGLSQDVPDHPRFKARMATANALAAACTQNYACNTTDVNRGPGQATVAVLIGNVAQCTGTLLNNTRQDGRPYILTARHCQSGDLAGGNPGMAGSVSIYWGAVTACGTPLRSLYSVVTDTQYGARTVVEQQDAWLIELSDAPRIREPFFAGWDASGNVFSGGYSVHHALGGSKQFTAWSGQALLQRIPGSTVQAPYDLDFWGVVNSLGNVGSGASGGALFDPMNRVVGSASLAYIDGTGDGVCPAVPPPAPSASSVTAQYTALSGIWNSTRDTSSSTGNVTLRSVLDPDNTGQLAMDGFGVSPVTLTASNSNPRTDQPPITLTWNASWAQSCTASGGRPGDGWAGARPNSGSTQVMDYTGGQVRYTLACTGGNQRGSATATVDWFNIPPSMMFRGPDYPVTVGSSFELRWDGNVQPCTGSDGIAGDGWAGGKPQNSLQTLTATQLGVTTYTLSCGTEPRTAARQVNVEVVAPSVTMSANATRVRIGSYVEVRWRSPAFVGRCDGSGGTPHFAPNTVWVQPNDYRQATSDVPGVFTFTMTCTGGGLTSSDSVTVEWVDEPLAISLTAVSPRQEIHTGIGIPPGAAPNLIWTSNQTGCHLMSAGPFGMGNKDVPLIGQVPSGTAIASEHIAATYQYVLSCGGQSVSTTIEWVAPTPTVTITDTNGYSSNWIAGREYWLLIRTNTLPCTASGGVPGDGWAEARDISPQYSIFVDAPRTPGTYTYTMTCGSGTSVATTNYVVTVGAPAATLTASPASPAVGQYVTLTWNSNTGPCTANADGTGVNWGGANMNHASSGINTQTVGGTYLYTITCGAAPWLAHASTQVTFRDGASTELRASATSVPVNTPVTLTWVTGSTYCTANGGVPGDNWSDGMSPSGSLTVTSALPQIVTYTLNCSHGSASVQVTYTAAGNRAPGAPRPSTTLSASHATRTVGETVTLTWGSQNANSCFANGGATGDGWSGSVSLSGTMSVTRSTAGASTYSVTCTGATPSSTSETTVTFAASAPPPGSGGGGGGALDRYLLLALLMTLLAKLRSPHSFFRYASSASRSSGRG